MQTQQGSAEIGENVRPRLTKKESEILDHGAPDQIKGLSQDRVGEYVKLVRNLRDKYRDLTRRKKVELKKASSPSQNLRSVEKAKIFDQALNAFQAQFEKNKAKSGAKKAH
jgi:hypothetical protein